MKTNRDIALAANMATIANAIQIGTEAIMKISGADVSNCIDGVIVRPQDISEVLAAKLQAGLSQHVGG